MTITFSSIKSVQFIYRKAMHKPHMKKICSSENVIEIIEFLTPSVASVITNI